ncbi:MAG: hypothetical protein AAF570_22845 [Bacteroidota bacterium]
MPYRKPAPAPTLENTPRKKKAPMLHVKRQCHRTIRHVGTGDHLHVSLMTHDNPQAK